MKTIVIAVCAAFVGIGIFAMALIMGFLQALMAGTLLHWLWNRLGDQYFTFLPVKYLTIPWFDMVLLTWLFFVIGNVLFKTQVSGKNEVE